MEKYDIRELIKESTELGDIESLRRTLIMMIHHDENFSKGYFENSIKYIKENIDSSKKDKIYEKLDTNIPMILNHKKDNFTKDDFIDAICRLKQNFCIERVEEVKKIGKALYDNKQEVNSIKIQSTSGGPSSNRSKKKQMKLVMLILIIGILLGLANMIKIIVQQHQ